LWALALVPVIAALALLLHPSSGRADPAIEPEEAAFLEILNTYRTQNGRTPLLLHPQLNAAADWFAVDMATDNYWGSGHWDNENPPRLPPARAAAFGYNHPVGENIAGGYSSAQSVFNAWKGSPGHNANMLYSQYRVIGIGRAYNAASQFRYYWVTDFGIVNSIVPTPTSSPAATPTEQPTPVPTLPPTPTPSPSATPTPNPVHVWTDLDCSGGTDPGDTIAILAAAANVAAASAAAGCPVIGEIVVVDGIPRLFGDIDCSGVVEPHDTVVLLRYLSGFGWSPPAVGCPPPGTQF
jgi:Cysteine-rich secretory protein family